MWSQNIVRSTEYIYQLSSWNLKEHMDNKTKIKRGLKTNYISVSTTFEEIILIHEAMNVEQKHSYVTFELLWQEKKIIKSCWATWVKWS